MTYPTNPIYKLMKPIDQFDKEGNAITEPNGVEKMDGEFKLTIPFKPLNRHYQEYLEWVAEGNTAEAAD